MDFILHSGHFSICLIYFSLCFLFFIGLTFKKWTNIEVRAKAMLIYTVGMSFLFAFFWNYTEGIELGVLRVLAYILLGLSVGISAYFAYWIYFVADKNGKKKYGIELLQSDFEVLESLKTAVLITNDKFQIIYVNEYFTDLFEYQKEEILGSDINQLIPEAYHREHNKKRAKYAENPDVREMGRNQNLHGISKTGKTLTLDISITPRKPNTQWQYLLSFHDLTEIRALQEEKDSDNKIRHVLTDELPVLISYVDKDLNYRFVNKTYGLVWQKKTDEIVGKNIFDILPKKQHDLIRQNIEKVLKGNKAEFDISFEKGQSEFQVYSCTYMPRFDNEKNVIGFAVVAFEITELELGKRELSLKNKNLEEYAYIVSHDLRAPMRHISNFTELLLEELIDLEDKDPNIDKYAEIIVRNSLKMQEMITGMLTLSNVSNTVLNRQSLVLANYIQKNIEDSFEDNDITYELDIPDKISVKIDPSLFFQIFQNLISNSIKYSSTKPHIKISAILAGPNLRIRYTDNSIGIDRTDFNSALRPFWKKNSGTNGPGLGLSIVKRIVELHSGVFGLEDSFEGLKVVMDWERL